jgi:hypothetical protein
MPAGRRDGWRCQRKKPRPGDDLITALMSQVPRLKDSGLTVGFTHADAAGTGAIAVRIANRPKRHNGA